MDKAQEGTKDELEFIHPITELSNKGALPEVPKRQFYQKENRTVCNAWGT